MLQGWSMRPNRNRSCFVPTAGDRSRRLAIACRVFLLLGILSLAPPPSRAGDAVSDVGPWRAVTVQGTVGVGPADAGSIAWTPLSAATVLDHPSEVAPGPDGEADLANGLDRIRMSPNSSVVLPAVPEAGLLMRLKQTIGTLFFDVGHRPDRRFEVDAPYLVVLVKGTRFTVHAGFTSDSVGVERGSVEVRAVGGQGVGALLHFGETATVAAGGNSVTVGSGAGVGGAAPGDNAPGQGRSGDPQGSHSTAPKGSGEPELGSPPGDGGDGNSS